MLRQLAGEGYVVLHENRGAQVAPMTHKTLRNFFMAAPMIYAAVTRLAAEHATPAQIMRLKDTQTLFRAAIRDGDVAERALLNQRFHAVIGEMADNEYLSPSLRRLLIDHTRIGMTFYSPRKTEWPSQRRRRRRPARPVHRPDRGGRCRCRRRSGRRALGAFPRPDRKLRHPRKHADPAGPRARGHRDTMSLMKFEGIYTPAITPHREDGSIDRDAFVAHDRISDRRGRSWHHQRRLDRRILRPVHGRA